MKLRVTARTLLSNPSYYRAIPKYTLCAQHRTSLFFCSPHLARCKLWVASSINSCQWGIYILLIHLFTRRPRPVLWILYSKRDMKHWSNFIPFNHSYRLHRICAPMRTNKILRCYSNYKPFFSDPLYW